MNKGRVKLSLPSIVFIVLGTLCIFATVSLYNVFIHSPGIEYLCENSCESKNQKMQTLASGYVASSITERCYCASPENPKKSRYGYFFVENKTLDWLLLALSRLIPIGIILLVLVFIIAKITARIEG